MPTNGPGVPPVPTALRKLRGNPRRRPYPKDEPMPELVKGKPICPAWLSPEGKTTWKNTCKALQSCGLLSQADRDLLAVYCDLYGRYVKLKKTEKEEGLAVIGHKSQMELLDRILRIGAQFGLSPSSRTKLRSELPQQAEPENPLTKYLQPSLKILG